MTTWTECREHGCDAPAETVDTFYLRGTAGDGKRVRVWFDKRWCAAGHWNLVEIYEEDEVDEET